MNDYQILMLDMDGVLNAHVTPCVGRDMGINVECCRNLWRVLRQVECRIVLSSAWRYMGFGPDSVYGQCLRAVGFADIQRLTIDRTRLEQGPEERHLAILDWVDEHKPKRWVAVDDLEEIERLPAGHWLRTDGKRGFTISDAHALRILIERQGPCTA
jgi:hypothetical protein